MIRRRIYLLNKPFQFRFSFYVCSWLIVLSLAYPLIISNLFEHFFGYLAKDPLGPGLVELEKLRQELLLLLGSMQIIFLVIAFFISIFMSHKIAGPLYKLGLFFKNAQAGNLDQKLAFRKRDYFQELVPAYNGMMDSIRLKLSQKQDGITGAINSIEKVIPNSTPEMKKELELALVNLRIIHKN